MAEWSPNPISLNKDSLEGLVNKPVAPPAKLFGVFKNNKTAVHARNALIRKEGRC